MPLLRPCFTNPTAHLFVVSSSSRRSEPPLLLPAVKLYEIIMSVRIAVRGDPELLLIRDGGGRVARVGVGGRFVGVVDVIGASRLIPALLPSFRQGLLAVHAA